MKLLIQIFLGILIFGCSNNQHQQTETLKTEVVDSMVAVVNDTSFLKFITTPPVKTWEPDSADWKLIDKILSKADSEGIFDFLKKPTLQSMKRYYRQYAFYINDEGQRIVDINALCEILQYPEETAKGIIWQKDDWKNTINLVLDGGPCYWQVKINLTEQDYFDFSVNGEA